MLRAVALTNLLSFGSKTEVELGPLNVLIGPNGSGKSNFIEALRLLPAAPRDLADAITERGGVRDWTWRGAGSPTATLEANVEYNSDETLRYVVSFVKEAPWIIEERIEGKKLYYGGQNGGLVLWAPTGYRVVSQAMNRRQSVLSQFKDPVQYPQLHYLDEAFSKIRIFSEWNMGQRAPVKVPQPADLPNDYLIEDGRNLGLVLNKLRQLPSIKKALLEQVQILYEGINDVDVRIEGGTIQVFFQESSGSIPASRLSDGTLRWLSLLTILLHPEPPPLVCIEEPELGLHPDILPTMAKFLEEASTRMQIIVTTHSDVLVDALTHKPEAIIVCEKHEGATTMKRLDRGDLAVWLEKYSLGELWRSGEIGGNRW